MVVNPIFPDIAMLMTILNLVLAIVLWNASRSHFENGLNFLGWLALIISAMNGALFFSAIFS